MDQQFENLKQLIQQSGQAKAQIADLNRQAALANQLRLQPYDTGSSNAANYVSPLTTLFTALNRTKGQQDYNRLLPQMLSAGQQVEAGASGEKIHTLSRAMQKEKQEQDNWQATHDADAAEKQRLQQNWENEKTADETYVLPDGSQLHVVRDKQGRTYNRGTGEKVDVTGLPLLTKDVKSKTYKKGDTYIHPELGQIHTGVGPDGRTYNLGTGELVDVTGLKKLQLPKSSGKGSKAPTPEEERDEFIRKVSSFNRIIIDPRLAQVTGNPASLGRIATKLNVGFGDSEGWEQLPSQREVAEGNALATNIKAFNFDAIGPVLQKLGAPLSDADLQRASATAPNQDTPEIAWVKWGVETYYPMMARAIKRGVANGTMDEQTGKLILGELVQALTEASDMWIKDESSPVSGTIRDIRTKYFPPEKQTQPQPQPQTQTQTQFQSPPRPEHMTDEEYLDLLPREVIRQELARRKLAKKLAGEISEKRESLRERGY